MDMDMKGEEIREITIQKSESREGKPLVLIWFGDKQVLLNKDEFESLKNNIDSFENSDIKFISYTTYFRPSDNHNEYIAIHTKFKGKEHYEIFALKHRKEREEYLDHIKQLGMISEEEYKRISINTIELADKNMRRNKLWKTIKRRFFTTT